jgi:hypothetical protein
MSTKKLNLGRHRQSCLICAHSECAEIESKFVAWRSPATIAKEFGLSDRASVYRHAHAFGLFEKRQRNVRAALECLIEQAGDVEVTASAIVQAVGVYAKINAGGLWIDRTEQVNLNDLFERMTVSELDIYAKEGVLPKWFEATVGSQQRTTVGGGDE